MTLMELNVSNFGAGSWDSLNLSEQLFIKQLGNRKVLLKPLSQVYMYVQPEA